MADIPHFTAEDVAFLRLAVKDYGVFAKTLPGDTEERVSARRMFMDRQFKAEHLLDRVWAAVKLEHGRPADEPLP